MCELLLQCFPVSCFSISRFLFSCFIVSLFYCPSVPANHASSRLQTVFLQPKIRQPCLNTLHLNALHWLPGPLPASGMSPPLSWLKKGCMWSCMPEIPKERSRSGRILNAGRVTATWSLHPGAVATNFSKNSGGLTSLIFRVFRPFLRTAENGASTSVYLASEPDITASNGSYFIDRKPACIRHRFFSTENNRKLWELSCELTGVDFLDGN